jgi:hypothetical protein
LYIVWYDANSSYVAMLKISDSGEQCVQRRQHVQHHAFDLHVTAVWR